MAQKLKIPKSLMSELTAEVLIEEGLYADVVKSRKVNEDFEAEVQTQAKEPENAPISDRETLALKAGAIKDGVETWFKEFKVDRDTIQLMHGNKARVSDGSGNSYIITFKVNSWNPPAVELKSLELVNISEFDDSTNIE